MTEYSIRRATEEDIYPLMVSFRAEDISEAEQWGVSPPALAEYLHARVASHDTWVGTVDGEVACMFGAMAGSVLSEAAVVWLLGTPLVGKHRKKFWGMCPLVVDALLTKYSTLTGAVLAGNIRSANWLTKLGFTVSETALTANGVTFFPFRKDRA